MWGISASHISAPSSRKVPIACFYATFSCMRSSIYRADLPRFHRAAPAG